MFMFMTTCWMYQLPSARAAPQTKQPPSLSGSDIPSGSFQGVMQQIPVQFNLKGPGGNSESVSYEATLTLKPIVQSEGISRPLRGEARERTSHNRGKVDMSESQQESLENMRRSPYFSLKLLRPTVGSLQYSSRERGEEEERRRMEVRKSEEVRKEKGEERREFEAPSREEAEKDVNNLLSGVSLSLRLANFGT